MVSTLLARRRGGDELRLGVDLDKLRARPARWPKASKIASTSARPMPARDERDRDLEDIPPLEPAAAPEKRQRLRTASAQEEEVDLPPSPVGLPGGWSWDGDTRSEALLLPPPFLDDQSTKDSFDGPSTPPNS